MSDPRSDAGRIVVSLARYCDGWTIHDHEGSVDLVHHNGTRLNVPADASSIRHDRAMSWARKIIRYADNATAPCTLTELRHAAGVKAKAMRGLDAELADRWPPAPTPDPPPAPKPPAATPPVAPPPRTVVNTRPARAVAHGQLTYDSNATLMREWSDGTVDYVCSEPSCDFSADNLRSVSSHRRAHGTRVGVNPPDGYDPDHVPEPRLQARIDSLAAEIQLALDDGRTLAHDIAAHVVHARLGRGDARPDDTPMTAEDILRRISVLVDRGESTRLRSDLAAATAAADEATRAAAEAAAQAADATARADKAEGSLNALKELLND